MNNNDNPNSLIYRQIIVSHYKNPLNYLFLTKDKSVLNDFLHLYYNSDFCIDEITVFLKLDETKTKIIDAKFTGKACAICTASTDICAEMLKNKPVKYAINLINQYFQMIKHEHYNEKEMDELIAFENIYLQPSRVNCATLGPNLFLQLLNKHSKKNESSD
ncbi:iron-sulfur cluster assembly scaffold protein [Mycoplasma sp. SG1]|uniref:iron-sulfur cluster assembly scaffold protein n=1 Tax=Mycoplasma sp. SG1 TaxID=2810348 RepID=UPI0020254D19|nr:iron-sulfur cluster assembly scaffold protein [Mycoplasma sp. SG1]URM52747.1 iron-sulfur cluster assembly scaffold protein [Mycoplasma sp. SG1]